MGLYNRMCVFFFKKAFMTESGRDCLIKNTDNNNHNNNNIRIDRYCLICLVIKNWYMHTLYFRRGFLCFCTAFHCVFFLKAVCYFFLLWSMKHNFRWSHKFFLQVFQSYLQYTCTMDFLWLFLRYLWWICNNNF